MRRSCKLILNVFVLLSVMIQSQFFSDRSSLFAQALTVKNNLHVSEACEAFRKSLPKSVVSDFMEVPEDWENPQGKKIRVFYYYNSYQTEFDRRILRTPVAFFNGGPASDGHSLFRVISFQENFFPLQFIFMDQRGTGCSTPYPDIDEKSGLKKIILYTSRSIVKDAEAIRKKILGEERRWRVFGQSYGGMIVHRYLEVAPQGLEAAYSHGFAVSSSPLDFLSLRVESQFHVAQLYFQIYPDDESLIKTLQKLIPSDYCVEGVYKICGPAMLDGLFRYLGFSNNGWHQIHIILSSMIKEGRLDYDSLSAFVRSSVVGNKGDRPNWGGYIITQVETVPGLATAEDPSGCLRVHSILEEKGYAPFSWAFNECRLTLALQGVEDKRSSIKADPLQLDRVSEALDRDSNLKLFLYSGRKDSFAPPSIFEDELEKLENQKDQVSYREFPNSGHEGFYSEGQIWNDLLMIFDGPGIDF